MKVKLSDITKYSKGVQINGDDLIDDGEYIYLNGGINPSGRWSSSNVSGDTVTISEGGNSSGYVNYITEPFWCGAHCYYLYEGPSNSKYLYYALKSQQNRLFAIRSGACMPNIKKSDLGNFELEFDYNERKQDEVVAVLSGVELVIARRQKELELIDELIKARFVDMFGDNMENKRNFPIESLEVHANIVSGITKGRKTKELNLTEVPYMAVSNVKDGYIDWTTVKTILATSSEIEQYRLQTNDVLMTEGGDPDKLGRGALLTKVPENCIHQNHIFRVRLDSRVNPIYFEEYLQTARPKRYFLKAAKQTTGIASINMTQLRHMPLILPPMEEQKEFADFVHRVDKSKVV